MTRRHVVTLATTLALASLASIVRAQTPVPVAVSAQPKLLPPAAAAPAPPKVVVPTAPTPEVKTRAANVRVEITFTDKRGRETPMTKTISLVTADGMSGSIRTGGNGGVTQLNIDAHPTLLPNGKIRLGLSLVTEVPSTVQNGRGVALTEQLSLVLDSGKSVVASETPDASEDRLITVEVKATTFE